MRSVCTRRIFIQHCVEDKVEKNIEEMVSVYKTLMKGQDWNEKIFRMVRMILL